MCERVVAWLPTYQNQRILKVTTGHLEAAITYVRKNFIKCWNSLEDKLCKLCLGTI